MGRLIDADAFMKAMYHRAFETDDDTMWQSGCWVRYRAVEQTVREQPTVDAVPVVRCKDCKYWREYKYAKETRRYIPFCGFNAIYTKADDFCSKGVRRTNDNNR